MVKIEYRVNNYDKVFKKFFWTKKSAESFLAAKQSRLSNITYKEVSPRKVIALTLILLGAIIIVGTVGGSDMHLEMSMAQIFKQVILGFNLIILGIIIR